jgi:hypothetical protein
MSAGKFSCLAGFAAFFAIFEITRRVASRTKIASQSAIESWKFGESRTQSLKRHLPRTVHGFTLVSGGVVAGLAYEFVSRPFDIARKAVQQDKVMYTKDHGSAMTAIMRKTRQDGIATFFRDPSGGQSTTSSPGNVGSRRLYATLRTLARVGPWGVGFLAWEAFGPGIS